ncbi:MAG: TonB-dependent receptor [Oceanospirillaceae bacterium]|nr:TonB-dependent receptor [Oceanospirillaceae bacterium]
MPCQSSTKFRLTLQSACVALSIIASQPLLAQHDSNTAPSWPINLTTNDLGDALNALAKQASLNLSVDPELIQGIKAPTVSGQLSVEQTFERLLKKTQLDAIHLGKKNYVLQARPSTNSVNGNKLPTLTITGEKVARSMQQTNTSVSVIQGDKINSSEQSSVYQAMERMPNIANDASGLPSIRGISGGGATRGSFTFLSGARPRVNTSIDGVSQTWAGQRYLDIGMWDVQQVEVLRGSQSTTQGRNSLGGAIVIKSNDPSFEQESALRLGYQNSAEKFDLAAMISGPIIEDELAFRVSAQRLTGHGYIDYSLPDNATPSWDPSEIKRQEIRAKLLWEPANIPELSAKLTLSNSLQQGEYLNFIEQSDSNADCASLANLAFCGQSSRTRRSDSSSSSIVGDIEYQLSDQLDAYLTLNRNHNVSKFSQSDGNLELDQDEVSNSLEARLVFSPDRDKLSGVLGLYYFDRDQTLNAGPNTFNGDDQVKTFALYTDTNYQITDQLQLLAGARIEREQQQRDVLAWPTTARESRVLTDIDETVFLPKIGLSYTLNPQTTLALTIRKGYTPGAGAINFDDFEYYEYDKEEVITYEFSSRSQLLDQSLSINTNLFYSQYSDYQALYNRKLVNIAKGTSYGLEIEASLQASTSLNLFASAGLLHTEITDPGLQASALKGNAFNSAPPLTASIGFNNQLPSGIHFGGNVSHTGAYFSEIDNTAANKAGNYTVANINLGYKQPSYQVRAYVKNLTDEQVVYSYTTNSNVKAVVGQPRTFGISLDYQF